MEVVPAWPWFQRYVNPRSTHAPLVAATETESSLPGKGAAVVRQVVSPALAVPLMSISELAIGVKPAAFPAGPMSIAWTCQLPSWYSV